jgi:DNA processing protein
LPSPEREKLRHVALIWGAVLGPAGFARLVAAFGSTREVLAADVAALSAPTLRLTPEQIAVIPTLDDRLEDFAQEMEELGSTGVSVVCPWEEAYPGLLRGIANPPPVLCMAGRVLGQDEPAVAIVGTRSPTEEGYAMSRRLAEAFAAERTTVVSGLARGCDTAAHVGALEGCGRTIAVLGSGIRVIHPRENLELARDISQHGAVISEQPPLAHPTVGRLMARNRLQSALSRGVIVVETREKGGAMATAEQAVEQGRNLYAVRWPDSKELAEGTNKLLREGAHAISGPEDVPAVRLELVDHIARMERVSRVARSQRSLFDG